MQWKKREKEIAALRAKHRGSKFKVALPSLAIEQNTAPLGNNIQAISVGKRMLPKDAKYFPSSITHKSNAIMITDGMIRNGELAFIGGKKI